MNLKQSFEEEERVGEWCSISKIEINNNRLNIDNKIYKDKVMLKSVKNCSGNYNIDEIKSVKFSSKQLWGIIFIFFYTLMFICIISCIFNILKFPNGNSSKYAFEIILPICIIFLLFIISLRIKTIKITFNDNKIIHIPIKPLIGSYLSIDYKEEIIEFMNRLKMCRNKRP